MSLARRLSVAVAALLLPAVASAQLGAGANSRGYIVKDQIFVNDPACATSGFFPPPTPSAWTNQNVQFSTGSGGCASTNWDGTAIMNASARTIRSFGSVATTGPLSPTPGSGSHNLVALARSAWRDGFTARSTGAQVNVVRFSVSALNTRQFGLNGTSTASFTTDLGMRASSSLTGTPPFNAATIDGTGLYNFSFGFAMDTFIGTEFSLQTFATLSAFNQGGGSWSNLDGFVINDAIASIDRVTFDYCDQGGCEDRTATADVEWQSGTDFSAVPEPSTYALMATGLLGVLGGARRRRRQ